MTAVGSGRGADVEPREIVYLTAPDCHLCEHGRGVLDELGRTRELRVREVDMTTDDGRALLARVRVPFPPAVIVDGELVAHGRLSARRLARVLDHRTTARR